jgi:hypothetical protein
VFRAFQRPCDLGHWHLLRWSTVRHGDAWFDPVNHQNSSG